MHDRGAHEIDARVRTCERHRVQMVAAQWAQRPHEESHRSQQLRHCLAEALHELAARVESRMGSSRISASSEQPASSQ
jgi:hypothetical protein